MLCIVISVYLRLKLPINIVFKSDFMKQLHENVFIYVFHLHICERNIDHRPFCFSPCVLRFALMVQHSSELPFFICRCRLMIQWMRRTVTWERGLKQKLSDFQWTTVPNHRQYFTMSCMMGMYSGFVKVTLFSKQSYAYQCSTMLSIRFVQIVGNLQQDNASRSFEVCVLAHVASSASCPPLLQHGGTTQTCYCFWNSGKVGQHS